jgi:redox-sensitive bicupin YhaK (pirin superfamily)
MLRAYAPGTIDVMLSRRGFVAGSAGAWLVGCLARRFDGDARTVADVVPAEPRRDGAGVALRRALGTAALPLVDPFLMLDEIRSADPADYRAGFPTHPHRGFETVSYVLAGAFEHADSVGNRGSIADGGAQWMTAGRGIVHQEMPHGDGQGRMHGFQLWANLPKAQKMTAPRYQEVKAGDVTEETDDDGTRARIISGEFWNRRGPVEGVAASPQYVDIWVPPGVERTIPVERSRNAFAYVFEGSGTFRDGSAPRAVATDTVTSGGLLDDDRATYGTDVANRSLTVFDAGDEIRLRAGAQGMRFLLVSGAPIKEPIAWYGPVVMNTQDEIKQAFAQLRAGTFLDIR